MLSSRDVPLNVLIPWSSNELRSVRKPQKIRQLFLLKSPATARLQKLFCTSGDSMPIRVELEDGSILFKFDGACEGPMKSEEEVLSELKEVQQNHHNLRLQDVDATSQAETTPSDPSERQWTHEHLSDMKVKDLKQLCREYKIRGVSNLRKAELIDAMLLDLKKE